MMDMFVRMLGRGMMLGMRMWSANLTWMMWWSTIIAAISVGVQRRRIATAAAAAAITRSVR